MSKNIDIEELITLNYEIEGLLYLALHRGSDTPDGVWRLIEEKVRCLNDAIVPERNFLSEELPPIDSSSVTVSEPGCSDSELSEIADPVDVETETSTIDVEVKPECLDRFVVLNDDVSIESLCEIKEEIASSEVLEEKDDLEPNSDKPGFGDELIEDVTESNVEEADEPEEDKPSEDVHIDSEKFADNFDVPLDDADECLDEADEDTVIRLDEKLARDYSKNLRKAFSLNDKFRFRRELFSNSDTEMTDTLNLVEAMSSYSEAEEYFYTDLQWNPEMPEVIDFMAIIKKHFS